MIDLALIQARVAFSVSCPVARLEYQQPSLLDPALLPRVYIGYRSIVPTGTSRPEDALESYEQNLEDLSLVFETQIVCLEEALPVLWRQVYDGLVGWYPLPNDRNYSGIGYLEGGLMGKENNQLWWLDHWKINFPRMNSV